MRRVAALCIEMRCRPSRLKALMPPTRRGTNRIIGLCLLCLFVAAFADCHGPATVDVVKIEPEVEPHPPRVGQVTIAVRMTEAGKPVTGAHVRLEGTMSHAGMSPVFADTLERAPGEYRANMELSMAGDWIVLVHLTLRDGTKLERQFEIKGVAPA